MLISQTFTASNQQNIISVQLFIKYSFCKTINGWDFPFELISLSLPHSTVFMIFNSIIKKEKKNTIKIN